MNQLLYVLGLIIVVLLSSIAVESVPLDGRVEAAIRDLRHMLTTQRIARRQQSAEILARMNQEVKENPLLVDVELCEICFKPMTGDITALQCKHVFHRKCIKSWLKKHKACPECQNAIHRDFVDLKTWLRSKQPALNDLMDQMELASNDQQLTPGNLPAIVDEEIEFFDLYSRYVDVSCEFNTDPGLPYDPNRFAAYYAQYSGKRLYQQALDSIKEFENSSRRHRLHLRHFLEYLRKVKAVLEHDWTAEEMEVLYDSFSVTYEHFVKSCTLLSKHMERALPRTHQAIQSFEHSIASAPVGCRWRLW